MEDDKKIYLGKITGVHGIKGWLKIQSFSSPPENIFNYPSWIINKQGKEDFYSIENKRKQNNKILASISYCKTIINLQSNGLLLGPLAVKLEQKGKGFGVQLVEHTLSLINDDSKFDFVIVVGDLDYYERFGFNRIEQDIKFYGPVDKKKLLLKTIKKDLLFKGEKSLDFS